MASVLLDVIRPAATFCIWRGALVLPTLTTSPTVGLLPANVPYVTDVAPGTVKVAKLTGVAALTVELLPKTTAPDNPLPTVMLLPITIALAELTVLPLPIIRVLSEPVGNVLLLPKIPDSFAPTVPLLLPIV